MNDFILAADIGGSHISSTVINTNDWQIMDANIHKSFIDGFASKEAILEIWCNNLKESIQSHPSKSIQKLTVAMPGPFDYEKGTFQSHPEGKFGSLVNVNFRRVLQEKLGGAIEVLFENDAACFGIGESYFGQSKNYLRSIAITLGTGIGATFIANHQAIKNGKNIPQGGELYNQEFQASIADDYFSTRWFVKEAASKFNLKIDGVKELLEIGNKACIQKIFQTFTQSLHQFLLPFAQQFKAKVIVIGGSIAKAWVHFGSQLEQLFQADNIVISPSSLQEKAILLGAAKSFGN